MQEKTLIASKTHAFHCCTSDVILVSVRVPFSKLQRRFLLLQDSRRKHKACRKYFTFCKQGEQVCFLTTLLFLPKLHCCSILFCPARFRKTFRVSKATFMFILCRTESDLQRRHVFTFGSIQFAYSVLENSPLGPLVTPRANAFPPKYINYWRAPARQ